ncbi:alpha-mannosidase [Subtercola boreus]|uniref:Alpha-mannosidase n=1 Tax=Subtercola boreus TaxID=120213 RepID=A0A3E0VG04_9MICO|nr:glycoside hydrolase family 38 C-terminal domain-containing protein [Subtercola boreus]RFA07797.1 alpha-mannosidase [Subtercola boreus]TQL55356.1 alpha-mannosidase [Subtercola boreus]
MHFSTTQIQQRVERFRRERILPALHRATAPLSITAWNVPDEPVPFSGMLEHLGDFEPFAVGRLWGKPWGTVWFRVTGEMPAEWAAIEGTQTQLVVDLGYTGAQSGFEAEGTVYTVDGRIVKAVEPFNRTVPLGAAQTIDLLIEAASNPNVTGDWSFAPTPYGDKATAGAEPIYRLARLELGLLDETVWELEQDFRTLVGLAAQLPESSQRQAEIMVALDRAVDVLDPEDVAGTAGLARDILAVPLSKPAGASAHHLHAVGHAHIDSAWLWPTRETVRKVARTFSNVCDLIDEHPEFVFAASSAQQYAWLKEFYPELFERVRARVASGNFVPVGGMWVESDTNLPGGEALARQFVEGKAFFLEEFGVDTEEVWLPDSFGYSAALPQIAVAAGARWFLTQKISWNETNVMPHHTFHWEGIDGTQIFTHFPPVDLYNSDLSGEDLARAERQYAEKGRGTMSLVPFGYGDGGGGPTREMLAAASRAEDLEGSPTVELSSPRRFFEAAEAEYPQPPVWSGELYLEFHRGTYTSQARTKRGNRRSEHLLREAELWASTATVRVGTPYPVDALQQCWHTVLLQQFHDVLPGTSIAWVHQEAERNYARVARVLEQIIRSSIEALAGSGTAELTVNASPFAIDGVPALGGSMLPAPVGTVDARASADGWLLDNGVVRVGVDANGLIRSLFDLRIGRELVPAGTAANLLQLHRDTPNKWDAWDIDDHYRHNTVDLTEVDSVELVAAGSGPDSGPGPGSASLRIARSFGSSTIVQTLTLRPGAATLDIENVIDWHERQKLLKLAFPLDLHADRAASEIQFGHIFRSTHANTSWDAARFETSAHRWVHVGERDYGVVIANDSTYGHDIGRTRPPASSTPPASPGSPAQPGSRASATTVRLSLLRAPTFPDPAADQGLHTLNVSVGLGANILDAVEAGYRRNLPLRTFEGVGSRMIEPLLTVDNPAIVVEAVKLARDGSGDVVVRLYESTGSRSRATVTAGFATSGIHETDLLERPVPPVALVTPATAVGVTDVRLELRPFQLLTLRFTSPRP